MSSAPTLKELVKAINGFVPTATLPLPDDLVEIIEGYLRKHEEKAEDSVSDKLNDELLSIFHKDVAQTPPRYTAFLSILRRLRPLIGQPAKIYQWFELLLPVLDHLNQEKGLAAESQGTVLDILTADDGNDTSTPIGGAAVHLAERILMLWFGECEVPTRTTDPNQGFKEWQLRNTLVLYGKKRPKDFMGLLDQYVCKKAYRGFSLTLLSVFVQHQPPHLYLILQTPLFGNLTKCLQQDTSTMMVSLALTSLTMILPHIPSSLVPHLPTLFNIYARLLFWERELSNLMGAGSDQERRLSANALAWERSVYSPDVDDTSITHLQDYFTVLYGLYPINFMDYIRKPQRYLRHAEVPDSDDIEVQPTEIRHASEKFRQCHLLHENFYTLTIDSEKTDFGRWIKSEPAEVVADCVALCHSVELSSNHEGPVVPAGVPERDGSDAGGRDSALLSTSFPLGTSTFSVARGENRQSTGSTLADSLSSGRAQSAIMRKSSQSSHRSNGDSSSARPSGEGRDSPNLSRQLVTSGSQTQLQDMINSNKAIKSGVHQSMSNDSVPSLALSHHDSIAERSVSQLHPIAHGEKASSATDTASADHAQLVRQILLLHNDLTFERFMKQQHLTHMGELRRRHVREAASEAETQNLIIANRHLKQRLEEAKRSEKQVKTESEKSRTLAKKWEADLTTKLRALREEQRKWNLEGAELRTSLEAAETEADKLRKLVCEAEVRELGWKQNMQSVEINVGELERLRTEVERLTESQRDYQAKEAARQAAMTRAAEADSRAQTLDMRLQARDSDMQQTHDLYQSQIVVLNAKLQDALSNSPGPNVEGIKPQVESALAASRAQQMELKKRITDLTRKNTAMQATILELESELQSSKPHRSKSDPRPAADLDLDFSSDSGSPLSSRIRQHRGFSNPENFEPTSFNQTPPLEPFIVSRSSSGQARPSTPLGAEGPSTGKRSPTNERYFGRGGVQNLRKDRKDKKDDKEKKKSTGLRGIRGFV